MYADDGATAFAVFRATQTHVYATECVQWSANAKYSAYKQKYRVELSNNRQQDRVAYRRTGRSAVSRTDSAIEHACNIWLCGFGKKRRQRKKKTINKDAGSRAANCCTKIKQKFV